MSKIQYKNLEEIEKIRESDLLVSKTLAEVAKIIGEGVKTIQLNKLAEEFIRDHGGVPAFLNYNGFPYSLCISLNDQVVHGFPGEYVIKDGDIVSVDCGVVLNGFVGDSAYTFPIGNVDPETLRLLKVTKECLYLAIDKAVVGMRVGDVGYAVQEHAEKNGYGRRGSGIKLEEGMVIAIEPMINGGKAGVKFWDDGWTVSTIDKKPSAHYEHSVAVKRGKADVLSTFQYIEEVLKQKD